MNLATLVRLERQLPPPDERQRIREAAGASRQLVGDEVGVTAESVRNWELGRRHPTGVHLKRYIAALEIMRDGAA